MLNSLYIGATGMQAQQTNVDVIANNLANANTPSYKRGRVLFEDLIARASGLPQAGLQSSAPPAGLGVVVSSSGKLFTEGELRKTDSPMDVAIRGTGFLEVALAGGGTALTRAGTLTVNREGLLADAAGRTLRGDVAVPPLAHDLVIDAEGRVSARVEGETKPVELGQLELAWVTNPAGLQPIGENLYRPSAASGEPAYGKPGDEGLGTLVQGYQEASNVRLVDEMVNLVLAQRAYELNARLVQAADEMLSISNGLRR
jgi:flagellar basal-body rod protein FlgG